MLKNLLKKFIDFYLYSSIHIALGALLSVVLCYAVLYHLPTGDYPLFVFCATLFLYCAHRIVGIKKVKAFEHEGRFAIIKRFRSHLIFYTILGAFASIYFYLNLSSTLQLLLIIPGAISLLYILPIFSKNRRLRDFNNIKIFLISISWGLIIALIPYYEVRHTIDLDGALYFLEKSIFIFSITIPFDIRDLAVDRSNGVRTLPSRIGVKSSYKISYTAIVICMILVFVLYLLNLYAFPVFVFLVLGYSITAYVLYKTENKQHDYYYAGALDATIIIIAILGIVASGLLGVLF